MDNISKKLMMGACEIACRYPSLSLEDAVGDARQLAEMIGQYGIGDTQKEESILTAACWFIGADPRNTPTCVGKTLRDYSLFLLSRQNNIEASSFSDTSCSPDNSMSWRFGSPMP